MRKILAALGTITIAFSIIPAQSSHDPTVTVVLYNDLNVEGDMTVPWSPDDEQRTDLYGERRNLVRTIKAQVRYAQDHFETHGRAIRVIAQRSSGVAATCDARRADADHAVELYEPIAAVAFLGDVTCYADRLADHGVPTFGFLEHLERSAYRENRPFLWSVAPDMQLVADLSAGFICRSLEGRPARFATDPSFQTESRTFALIFPTDSQRGASVDRPPQLLIDSLRAACGFEFAATHPYDASVALAGLREAPEIMTDLKRRGITTVVCYCLPVATELTVSIMQDEATALGYLPEWYWDRNSAMDLAAWHRLFGSPVHRSFGATWLPRQPVFDETDHYRAYRTVESDSEPNAVFNFRIYHAFRLLFHAVERTGFPFTAPRVRDALFGLQDRSGAPFTAEGGFGSASPSPFTFVDTGMAWWWDPAARPPGGNAGEGCLRVADRGQRYRPGEWPPSDAHLFSETSPCNVDHRATFPGAALP